MDDTTKDEQTMNEPTARILDEKLKDGLENLIANLGTDLDKRAYSKFVNSKRLSDPGNIEEINALYRTDWLAGKVIDIIPNDMTREWRSFTGDIDPELVDLLVTEENRLCLPKTFNLAHKWGRLYGTAFIVMAIDDGLPVDQPLNMNSIKKGGLRHIKVVDRHRMNTSDIIPINDPMNPKYGMPEYYRINETSVKIHHSRVLRFDGVMLPFDEFRRNNYFSDSVLDRLYDAITNLNTVTTSSASMVYETNVDIMKVEGLMNYLQTEAGELLLRRRFALASTLKSFNNMLLLDSKEDFTSKTNSFSGLPDLIDRFSQILSAATDIPATRLLGNSASGMNATGEGDLKNYYDKIRSDQNFEYKPLLDHFDIIMAKSLGLPDGIDLEYKFNSLFQMTPEQEALLQKTKADRDAIYLDRGVVTEEIVAKELQQDGTYTNITDDFISMLEDIPYEPETDPIGIENTNEQTTPIGTEEEAQPDQEPQIS